jgi:glycosyltransferase involved in cell wall biosynthesis
MNIAIITSGRLPVPATKGGAVETKLDYLINYNIKHHIHNITLYSISPDLPYDVVSSEDCKYVHIDNHSILFRIGQRLYKHFNKNPYYDSYIEYFLYLCLRHIKKRHYDVIITTNRPGYTKKIADVTATPIILQLDNDYLNPGSPDAQEIKALSTGVITCSHFINRMASKVTCRKNVPVVTIHNGIDVSRFANATGIIRDSLGLTPQDYVVIYCGRVIPEKGVLELIQAIKTITDIESIKLLIVGASFYGKDSVPSPYIQQLKSEAESIKDKVIFTGYVDYKDMPNYLKTANLAVVPSTWDEPFGLTVLEAMAAGLPLITTRGGGIPEICEGTAILIERGNIVRHIADSIRFMYNHPETAHSLGEKAAKRSWEFDKDIFCRDYFKQIEYILRSSNSSIYKLTNPQNTL